MSESPVHPNSRIAVNRILLNCNCQTIKQHKGGLNSTRQRYCPGISEYMNWKKLLVVGREKGSILQESVKCVLYIGSEVRLDTGVNWALFRFTKGLVLRNTIRRRTVQSQAQEHNLECQIVICYGDEHSKRITLILCEVY
jgi:hypothetical protein